MLKRVCHAIWLTKYKRAKNWNCLALAEVCDPQRDSRLLCCSQVKNGQTLDKHYELLHQSTGCGDLKLQNRVQLAVMAYHNIIKSLVLYQYEQVI